jgi:hypothetical protein
MREEKRLVPTAAPVLAAAAAAASWGARSTCVVVCKLSTFYWKR